MLYIGYFGMYSCLRKGPSYMGVINKSSSLLVSFSCYFFFKLNHTHSDNLKELPVFSELIYQKPFLLNN